MDKIYTTQEIADKLKIKKNTVYELIKRGDLAATKVGKQLRISQYQLDRYLGITSEESASAHTDTETSSLITDIPPYPADAAIRRTDYLLNSNGLIISSQESAIVELLRSQLDSQKESLPILYSYMNDYNSLYSLYYEKTHLALIDMCSIGHVDSKDIIHALLPGMSIAIIPLCDFQLGLYVINGNPKNIQTIHDLLRSDVQFINREKGCCCRILLDSMLKMNHLSSNHILGYQNDVLSHMSVASAIQAHQADVGIGDMTLLASYPQLEFIPLETASIYLIFSRAYETHPTFQALQRLIHSENFQLSLQHLKNPRLV